MSNFKDPEDEEFERIAQQQTRINTDMKFLSEELRNAVLEEVAQEFDKMKFGNTSQSFAAFVRNMKK
jgi:transcription elongation GreA/GreB family factor